MEILARQSSDSNRRNVYLLYADKRISLPGFRRQFHFLPEERLRPLLSGFCAFLPKRVQLNCSWRIWNIRLSFATHELFDEIAAGLMAHVDDIAERATALGGIALGTTRIVSESSQLEPYPLTVVDSMEIDTSDLFVEISRDLDQWLWFLEAHLQK